MPRRELSYDGMFDVEHLIQSGGYLIISLIIFAESGLLVGFFLPGDTLLFGAGLAASQGDLSLPILIGLVILAAVVGDNVGYSIGRRAGPRLFTKKDGVLFRQEYIERAAAFYEKHGGKTIILARFVPVVRTFAPVVAGASKMSRQRFFTFNVVGGVVWGAGMTSLGYFVGNRIPGLNKYLDLVILGVVALSLLLAFAHILKYRKTRQQLMQKMKALVGKILLNRRVD